MSLSHPITIGRFTNAIDILPTVTDKIVFNDGTDPDFKDSDKEGAYFQSFKVVTPEGLGVNQAATKPDGNIQALGVVEKTWVLNGFITKTDGNDSSGLSNSFLNRLEVWKEEKSVIKNIWEAGRFAILDSNDANNNVVPIGTGSFSVGLIFKNYESDFDPVKNRTNITLTFRRSRGADI